MISACLYIDGFLSSVYTPTNDVLKGVWELCLLNG